MNGELPTKEDIMNLIKTIPFVGDVIEIGELSYTLAKRSAELLAMDPDDDTPKTCWIRTQLRGLGGNPKWYKGEFGKGCRKDYVKSWGLCYEPCLQGVGRGPVCWGTCPPPTK